MRAALTNTTAVTASWAEANRAHLEIEFERLRLLFRRKVRWLRQAWRADQAENARGLIIPDAMADRLLSGADGDRELAFYREDPESAAATDRLESVEADLARNRQALTADGSLPSIEVLARVFGLSAFEQEVALLCLAVETDAGFASLCAYAQDDAGARYPTASLALGLFCAADRAREAARGSFLGSAPLRRFHLVALAEAAPGTPQSMRPLRIEERVADYLRGNNRLDESVAHLLRPVPAAALAGRQEAVADGLVRWAQAAAAGAGRSIWPVFNFTGVPGTGRRAVAREFCERVGLQLYSLDPRGLPADSAERDELLHVLEREAALSRLAFYIDATDLESSDRALASSIRDWAERAAGILIVGSRERWHAERDSIHIPVPKPDIASQRELWMKSLDGVAHPLEDQVGAIVQQFDLGPQAIPGVVAAALVRAGLRSGGPLVADDLWQACREQVGWRLAELAQRLEPCYGWDDIVLPEDILNQLREVAAQVAGRPRVYEDWGFGARLPRGRGISALFSGPSGAGKTMAAEILANHLRLDLYRIDLAGVVSKYIGETEKNLRSVFDAAEQSGAILLFDEADALFGKRSEVKDSHDRYANIEINYLLQRMEDYRGLAILCTNRRSAIDRAFLRRLRFVVEFPFPDCSQRRIIWQKVFPPQAPRASLDLDALARLELAGGNIRNIALNAAFLAAADGGSITMAHVLHAARREYAKIDKLISEAEFGLYYRMLKT